MQSDKAHRRPIGSHTVLTSCALGLVVVLAGCRAERSPAPDLEGRPPAPSSDIGLSVTLIPEDGTITAGEPLIARVTFTNQTDETLELRPGAPGFTHLQITDSTGAIVSQTPKPHTEYGEMWFSGRRLAPGEAYEKTWVLTAWYQFTEPGEYTIRVQQLDLKKDLPVLWEASESVRVLPFDVARLEARCEEFFQPIRKHASGDLDIGVRAKALYSVRNDLVLPYLDWMAREWGDKHSCLAMRRIGTERAEKLIDALALRKDRVGEAARQALEMPLEPTRWDMGD